MRDQRPREQRTNVTVAELAAELGRTIPSMYDLCNAQQVYARGSDCEISPSNADRLREAHADKLRRLELIRRAEEEDFEYQALRARHSGPADRIYADPGTATIARNLGAKPRWRDMSHKVKEPPLTGTAAAAERHRPGIARENAQQIAAVWTGEHYFGESDAAAWWSVGGLGFDDALLASVLREHGIRPEHLPVRVRGETIRDRVIEQGMAPEHVARILRGQNLL